ncbi:Protein SCO2, mitochondrial [Nakaseomyces bracarensis]|uniref:Protein SCO2, mitochondrial n=1 Tax=Nakaseomyces bracarensis TaxID=273131 RepID=A0ABR4NML4_9SACH
MILNKLISRRLPIIRRFSQFQKLANKKSLGRLSVNKSPIVEKVHLRPETGSGLRRSTWLYGLGLAGVAGATYYYVDKERKLIQTEKEQEANRAYGAQFVGGSFELVDTNGQKFTDENLKGKFSLIYFGFTHCPDICPEELDKMNDWVIGLESQGIQIQPIFITCDPVRDTPEVVKEYLKDFNPLTVGLTGTYEQIKDICKKYKVYFSTPKNADPKSDYLVDHSIFFYLIDPEGNFIDALGRIYDEKSGLDKIIQNIKAYVPKEERERRNSKWYSFLFK